MDAMEQQKFLETNFQAIHNDLKSVGEKIDKIETTVVKVGERLAVAETQRAYIETHLSDNKKDLADVSKEVAKLKAQVDFWRGATGVLYVIAVALLSGLITLAIKFINLPTPH